MKTKPISKNNKSKKSKEVKKPITNEEGDPIIEHLNDFVTSIKNTYTSKPIYTGGRILVMPHHIYATCNAQISILTHHAEQLLDKPANMSDCRWVVHKNEEIVNFCVCPQEKYLLTFTQNSMLRLILLQNNKIIHTLKVAGAFANDMAFSPDGRYFACAFGNQVQIFTTENFKRTHSYYPSGNNHRFVITRLRWHPNPESLQLITCDLQRIITVFDYIINKIVCSSEVGEGGSDFCLSENGKQLYSINSQEIRFYQLKGLQLKYRIPTEQYMECISIIGQTLLFGGQGTNLLSVNLSNSDLQIREHQQCTDNGINKIFGVTHGNQQTVFVLSFEQNITILKVKNNKDFKSEGMIIGYNDQIIDIKCSKNPQSQKYFVLVTNSNNVKVINSYTHKLQYLIIGHTNTVLCADFYYPYIATGGKDNEMKFWEINEDKHRVQLLGNYHGHSGDILSICLLYKQHQIATISDDHTLKLWPMISKSGQTPPNSKIQIRSSLHTVPAHAKTINSVRACPKHEFIATCSQDKTVKIWDLNLNLVMQLNGHKRGVWDIAFHERQKLIVSVGGEGMIKGWSLLTGENVWSMGEGPGLVKCAWIYYNQVVTGSADGIVKIWDIRKMTSLTYDKHEGKIWALDVCRSANNKAIIYTGATDSIYHVWEDNTENLIQNIMHKNQSEEQHKISYAQFMDDKNYIDATLTAFRAGYTKLFLRALEKLFNPFDSSVSISFNEQEELELGEQGMEEQIAEESIKDLVQTLKETNIDYLLNTVRSMNSTVKHYKIANRIFNYLLECTSVEQFMQINRTYTIKQENDEQLEELQEKKSGFHQWLEHMIGYTNKHSNRIKKYVQGTYWIDHLKRIENPYIN